MCRMQPGVIKSRLPSFQNGVRRFDAFAFATVSPDLALDSDHRVVEITLQKLEILSTRLQCCTKSGPQALEPEALPTTRLKPSDPSLLLLAYQYSVLGCSREDTVTHQQTFLVTASPIDWSCYRMKKRC